MGNTCYWEKCPPDPDDEWVGRLVKNSFDADETAQLMVRDWKHFDWLAEQGVNMEKWIKDSDIDRHRPEYRTSLSGELQSSLRFDERRRYLAGQPCPLFIEPEGYSGDIIEEKIPDRLDTDHEWFERNLVGKIGVEIPVSMQGRHWRYFDWIAEKNIDMDSWVIAADFETVNSKRSLATEMMGALRKHERDHFLNGNSFMGDKLPLFISPNGYMDIDLRKRLNEGVSRNFSTAKGKKMTVSMPKNYWRYFDWLGKQGINMDQWVEDADNARYKEGGMILSLRSELMLGLREDEKTRFKSDEDSPLYINPNGYKL